MTSSRVPIIVVDDRKDASSSLSSSPNHRHRHHTVISTSTSSTSSSSSSCPQQTVTANSPGRSSISLQSDASSTTTTNNSSSSIINNNNNNNNNSAPKINVHRSKPQITSRSSSDIGIPAASMPNLAVHQIGVTEEGGGGGGEGGVEGGSGGGCSDSYLGVYCSPRTTRRSVDLDLKETVPGQYDWMDSLDTSANSLKVLTASSRVGSALSLNSECTTRSIGLLSNDSDSEEFSQSENRPSGQGQLRRYMSYPEEGQIPESNARPSQSLSNLKSANHSPSTSRGDRYLQRQSLDYADLGESTRTIVVQEDSDRFGTGKAYVSDDLLKENESGCGDNDQNKRISGVEFDIGGETCNKNKPASAVSGGAEKSRNDDADKGIVSIDLAGSSGVGGRKQQQQKHQQQQQQQGSGSGGGGGGGGGGGKTVGGVIAWKRGGVIGSVKNANNNNMLCYKCDTNSPSREGRIRQWLQDMDTTHADDVI